MSLTTCPDCGREISTLAPACIHCGRPSAQPAAAPLAMALPECPLCGYPVTHASTRIGGHAWCERCGGKLIYGTDGALVRALPRMEPHRSAAQPVVIVGARKSVGAAAILALFFGPLGLLYATVGGGVVMFLMMIALGAATEGVAVPFVWMSCVAWAAHAATEHNRRLLYSAVSV
ncbi:MAG TPA: hypothetical protein VF142_20295 [Longimicrobium sp.]